MQKVHEKPSQPIKIWVWWCMPIIAGNITGRVTIQATPDITADLMLNNLYIYIYTHIVYICFCFIKTIHIFFLLFFL
jgi:hypothetical protein